MIKFSVFLSKTSIKFLKSLDKKTHDRIKNDLRELESDPFTSRPNADIKKLHKHSKSQLYRIRIGNYRAVYAVENNSVKVARIFPRGKGYEWLE